MATYLYLALNPQPEVRTELQLDQVLETFSVNADLYSTEAWVEQEDLSNRVSRFLNKDAKIWPVRFNSLIC